MGYFDKEKSDYDVFVIFKNKVPKGQSEIKRRFPRITLQYFCTINDLIQKINEGQWNLYITLLTNARVLYYTNNYKKLIIKLEKIDFVKNLKDTKRIEWKVKMDKKHIKNVIGYGGAKCALPSLRSRLQFLVYLKFKKLVWDLKKVIKLNSDFLDSNDKKFIYELNKIVKQREQNFGTYEKERTLKLIDKLSKNIFIILKNKLN